MRIPAGYIRRNFGYDAYTHLGSRSFKVETEKSAENMINGLNEVMDKAMSYLDGKPNEIKCVPELGNLRIRFFRKENGKRRQRTYSCRGKSWEEINQKLEEFKDWDYFKPLHGFTTKKGWYRGTDFSLFREVENPMEIIENLYENVDITEKIDKISEFDKEMGNKGLIYSTIDLDCEIGKNKAVIEGKASSTLFYEKIGRELEEIESDVNVEIGYDSGIWAKRIEMHGRTVYLEISELGGEHISFELQPNFRIKMFARTPRWFGDVIIPREAVMDYDKFRKIFPFYSYLWDGGWFDVDEATEARKEFERIPITRKELIEELKEKFGWLKDFYKIEIDI
jgi:hypothetical protein